MDLKTLFRAACKRLNQLHFWSHLKRVLVLVFGRGVCNSVFMIVARYHVGVGRMICSSIVESLRVKLVLTKLPAYATIFRCAMAHAQHRID